MLTKKQQEITEVIIKIVHSGAVVITQLEDDWLGILSNRKNKNKVMQLLGIPTAEWYHHTDGVCETHVRGRSTTGIHPSPLESAQYLANKLKYNLEVAIMISEADKQQITGENTTIH